MNNNQQIVFWDKLLFYGVCSVRGGGIQDPRIPPTCRGAGVQRSTGADIAVAKAIRTQELKHDPSRYAKNQIG